MQFACDSCKAQLQIADEKVRGKRLIVRCKRCGAKIGISDPALGAPKPRPKPSAPAPAVAAPLTSRQVSTIRLSGTGSRPDALSKRTSRAKSPSQILPSR